MILVIANKEFFVDQIDNKNIQRYFEGMHPLMIFENSGSFKTYKNSAIKKISKDDLKENSIAIIDEDIDPLLFETYLKRISELTQPDKSYFVYHRSTRDIFKSRVDQYLNIPPSNSFSCSHIARKDNFYSYLIRFLNGHCSFQKLHSDFFSTLKCIYTERENTNKKVVEIDLDKIKKSLEPVFRPSTKALNKNILLIASNEYSAVYSHIILDNLTRVFEQNIKDETLRLIDNKDVFDGFNINEETYDYIFIEADLNWYDSHGYDGYNIAEQFILHAKRPLNIQFISSFDPQKKILNENLGFESKFLFCFKHFYLTSSDTSYFNHFELSKISSLHFEFIRNFYFNSFNLLSQYKHDLKLISSINPQAAKNLNALKIQVENLMVREGIKLPFELDFSSVESALEVINQIQGKLVTQEFDLNEEELKVLVVEDDERYRALIYDILREKFQNVFPANTENYRVEEIIESALNDDYDLIFLDLKLCYEDGRLLKTNGFELYDRIKKSKRNTIVKIITGLPRNLISKFNFNVASSVRIPISDVISKSDGLDNFRTIFKDKLDDIINEIYQKNEIKNRDIIPKNGLFSENGNSVAKSIRGYIINDRELNGSRELLKSIQIANKILDQLKDSNNEIVNNWNRGKTLSTKQKQISEVQFWRIFPIILVHRMFLLEFYILNNFRIVKEDFEETIMKKFDCLRKSADDKTYATFHGFSTSKINDSIYKISLSYLFGHEVEFARDLFIDNTHTHLLEKWYFDFIELKEFKEFMELHSFTECEISSEIFDRENLKSILRFLYNNDDIEDPPFLEEIEMLFDNYFKKSADYPEDIKAIMFQ